MLSESEDIVRELERRRKRRERLRRRQEEVGGRRNGGLGPGRAAPLRSRGWVVVGSSPRGEEPCAPGGALELRRASVKNC